MSDFVIGKEKAMEEVLNYINKLKNLFEENSTVRARLYFNRGGCYKFACLLQKHFPQGEIAVTRDLLHVVFKFQNKFYDVDGEFLKTNEIIAVGAEIPNTVLKILQSYDFDFDKYAPKQNYFKVYDEFSYDEQEEFYDFCMNYNCIDTLNELEWREIK